jgi:hypothetical protein
MPMALHLACSWLQAMLHGGFFCCVAEGKGWGWEGGGSTLIHSYSKLNVPLGYRAVWYLTYERAALWIWNDLFQILIIISGSFLIPGLYPLTLRKMTLDSNPCSISLENWLKFTVVCIKIKKNSRSNWIWICNIVSVKKKRCVDKSN